MNSENTPVSTVLMAALGGAIVGAGIALLFAPQSGRKTRQKLSDLGEDAEEYAREILEKAEQSLGKTERKGEKLLQKVQDFVEDKKRQLAEAAGGAKHSR